MNYTWNHRVIKSYLLVGADTCALLSNDIIRDVYVSDSLIAWKNIVAINRRSSCSIFEMKKFCSHEILSLVRKIECLGSTITRAIGYTPMASLSTFGDMSARGRVRQQFEGIAVPRTSHPTHFYLGHHTLHVWRKLAGTKSAPHPGQNGLFHANWLTS